MGSDTIAILFNDPRTLGALPDADAIGHEGVPGEGPMFLKSEGDLEREALFETYSCP